MITITAGQMKALMIWLAQNIGSAVIGWVTRWGLWRIFIKKKGEDWGDAPQP
jgi:hypothetical protein